MNAISRRQVLGLVACCLGCGGSVSEPVTNVNGGTSGLGGSAHKAGGVSMGGEPAAAIAGGTSGGTRLSAAEATAIYTDYAFKAQPNLNPATSFELVEIPVPGFWEALGSELFLAQGLSQEGEVWRACSVIIKNSEVFVPTDDCAILDSGLIADGAFYYSWSSGAGIASFRLGKVVATAQGLSRTVSAGYTNSSFGPPQLVLQVDGARIIVLRANVAGFNLWSAAAPIGVLKDYGSRLAIVDATGQELPLTLPDESS